MKYVSLGLVTTIATLTLGTVFTPLAVSADGSSTTTVSQQNNTVHSLSESLSNIADKYVSYDANAQQYSVSSELQNVVSRSDFESVQSQVAFTNSFIQDAKANAQLSLVVVDHNLDRHLIDMPNINPTIPSPFANGKNAIEVYWNFVRIYLDKSNLNHFKNAGSAALGAYIGAHGGVAGAVIGAAVGQIIAEFTSFNNGMWFDYNYFIGITDYGWQ